MNSQSITTIGEKALFLEPVHETADAQPGCTDHAGESLLTDLGDYSLGRAFLIEMSKQEQNPRQSYFAGIEEMVN
jgi:hypothetical protein